MSKINTKLVHSARNIKDQGWMVNPPIHQTSTIAFPTYQDLLNAEKGYADENLVKPYELKYGRYGTQTNFTLEKAIADIEGGSNSFVTSCGASAINTALIAFLKQGDHFLIPDNVYAPTRGFAENFLKNYGIQADYYDPNCGSDIEKLIKKNTKIIFMESPGSLSFEICDVKAICDVAKKHDIITILDNSYAAGIYFKPFDHGVDISIQAITKYINGHSDVMMGSITLKNNKYFKQIHKSFRYMASTVSPNSCYLALRGLRTAKIRMDHSYNSALTIAKWLEQHPKISKVLYPALESSEHHELFKRDFTGAAGIFSIILDKKYASNQIANMVDNLKYYSMGYSWGGYESLILPFNAKSSRTTTKWPYSDKTCFRLNIGLEDVSDLQSDLEAGLKRLDT